MVYVHSLGLAGHDKETIIELGVEEIVLKKLEKHEQLNTMINSCKSLSSISSSYNC